LNNLGLIFLLTLIQSGYDFAGWYGILKESYKNKIGAYTFRTIKFLLDFPLTIFVLIKTGQDLKLIIAFYNSKMFGLCDFFYIVYWFVIKNESYNKDNEIIDWFFLDAVGTNKNVYKILARQEIYKRYNVNDRVLYPINNWSNHFNTNINFTMKIKIFLLFLTSTLFAQWTPVKQDKNFLPDYGYYLFMTNTGEMRVNGVAMPAGTVSVPIQFFLNSPNIDTSFVPIKQDNPALVDYNYYVYVKNKDTILLGGVHCAPNTVKVPMQFFLNKGDTQVVQSRHDTTTVLIYDTVSHVDTVLYTETKSSDTVDAGGNTEASKTTSGQVVKILVQNPHATGVGFTFKLIVGSALLNENSHIVGLTLESTADPENAQANLILSHAPPTNHEVIIYCNPPYLNGSAYTADFAVEFEIK